MHKSPNASVVAYNKIVPNIPDSVFLADGARVIGDVTLAENVSIWFNAVVRGDVNSIHIGCNSNVQDCVCIHGTYLKYSTIIGDCVSIGHGAIIHGCTIENNCLIGMGAIIMDGARIGCGSIIGAGAIVTHGTIIAPKSLVLGAPAKVIRDITPEEYESFSATNSQYLIYTKGYNFT